MMDLHKKNKFLSDLLQHSYISTKILISFATKSVGEDFDSYEKNYTYTNLNPQTVRGYVRDLKPEALVWKQYGLSEVGAKEIICDDKYGDWFRNCNKVTIDSDDYQVYKENVGNRCLITKLPLKLIKIVITKVK
jgi:hypothetical protein